ncbi:hypothetical protein DH2020_038553 [Rehmannia glutinosa]|uniref:UDENN domain-containing protein n=1 Tax=Rehmannia glutinosa TaxID=99300 RepID=A0ABR0UZG8_REHGL
MSRFACAHFRHSARCVGGDIPTLFFNFWKQNSQRVINSSSQRSIKMDQSVITLATIFTGLGYIMCSASKLFSKPLWDVIAYLVSNIPLPTPGKDRVLFAIENSLLAVEVPPKDGLPHADISFQPLIQCLDVDNFIKLFTAVLLERRILLRSDKYSLLTLVSEAICHLIYPFRWQHVYIPLLFFSGVDYIDAPTPYMMGLHSGVDTFGLVMDGVVVVDLEHNLITTTEEIPPIPEPEHSSLRGEILKLLHPNVVGIDQMKGGSFSEQCPRGGSRPWGEVHDLHLRFIFLKFFASILGGYRNFIENTATHIFNSQAFLKKRSRSTNQPPDPMISQFLDSQGFLDYLERGLGSEENGHNLLDKLQDAIGRGQNPFSILPSISTEPDIVTISDPGLGISGSGAKYCYDRFPANIRTEEQEEKRKQILAAASGALEYSGKHTPSSPSVRAGKDSKPESLSPRERAAERERMVLDIKVKLQVLTNLGFFEQGLWLRLLKLGATDDPLSSFEYGTILALIESDAEGIGGSGFVECIREHIHSLKTAISRATARNDMATIRDALKCQQKCTKRMSTMFQITFSDTFALYPSGTSYALFTDPENVTVLCTGKTRILISFQAVFGKDISTIYLTAFLAILLGIHPGGDECVVRYMQLIGTRTELSDLSSGRKVSPRSTNYATLVTTQLIIVATHMAGLGLPETDACPVSLQSLDVLCPKLSNLRSMGNMYDLPVLLPMPLDNSTTYDDFVLSLFELSVTCPIVVSMIQIRGFMSHIRQICIGYWGIYSGKSQSVASFGLPSPRPQDVVDSSQQSSEVSGVGRSWVQSMFSRDRASSFSRVRKWTSDSGNLATSENGSLHKQDVSAAGQKKVQTNIRMLRGHSGAVTALHCVTKREVWDLVGDREDAGFFISGSTDCTVKIWDPSLRGSELRATLKGHTRTVRAISSDRGKVVSGSDDQSVLVWDKQTTQLLEELKGHDAQVSIVRMLSGERVLTAAHDGTVKMWDVRTDTCVATVGRCSSAVLCMEYDDSSGVLAAGGRDAVVNIWDIRAGRQMHKLLGHSKWIRSIRMVGDTVITGSDDWTARMWSVSQGTCDAVLACHDGPVLSVEYSLADKGIITGSNDGLIRFWETDDGGIRCVKNVTIHNAPILSINAGEHWLGIGAADNSMSLFHRPQERLGGLSSTGPKMAGWQLYRTPQRAVAMVRCVASDLERKRICTGDVMECLVGLSSGICEPAAAMRFL